MVNFSNIINRVFSEKKNFFITGGAGTGKTLLINSITQKARELGSMVLLTASTGLASTHINGQTIHSVIFRVNNYLNKIKDADFLIIDEISMINQELFDKIFDIIKSVNEEIKIIVVGDFYQLPPVKTKDCLDYSFAFQSKEWMKADFEVIILEKSLRQNQDSVFSQCLSLIRVGDEKGIKYINQNKKNNYMDGAVAICDRKKNARYINSMKLKDLNGEIKYYKASNINWIKNSTGYYEKELRLKKGCQVMITINDIDGEYVNGSIGTVESMEDEFITVFIKDRNESVDIYRHVFHEKDKQGNPIDVEQFPIILAYAVTVHKSQGLSLERVNIIYDSFWEPGQLYTALSRCKTVDNIFIGSLVKTEEGLKLKSKEISIEDLKTNVKVCNFYNCISKRRIGA